MCYTGEKQVIVEQNPDQQKAQLRNLLNRSLSYHLLSPLYLDQVISLVLLQDI
jgi:hypothetical protein